MQTPSEPLNTYAQAIRWVDENIFCPLPSLTSCVKQTFETLDSNVFCYFDPENPLQPNWQGWAVQMLGGSTWHGLGRVVRATMYMVVALIRFIYRCLLTLVIASASCCDEGIKARAWKETKFCLFAFCYILKGFKLIAYHLIRAVPVIGYPVSQAINYASPSFYELECVKSVVSRYRALTTELGFRR